MPDENRDDRPRDDRPNDDGEFEGRTYLFIKDHPADTGAEPLPSGLPFWVSPDITVIKPDGTRGTEAVAGQQNQVEVFVNNTGGITAVDAVVDVFHADPSTAFNPMTAALIGQGPLTIPGYSRAQVTFPWTPLASESGHRCLLARVALFIPPDSYVDGTVFDVVGDRHVSQRNLHVIPVSEAESRGFRFKIVNPFLERRAFTVHAMEIRNDRELQALRQTLGCGMMRMAEEPLGAITIEGAGRKIDASPMTSGLRKLRGDDLTSGFARDRLLSQGLSTKVDGAEAQDALLMVKRSSSARPGDVHAVQVTQFDDERRVRGGLTILLQY